MPPEENVTMKEIQAVMEVQGKTAEQMGKIAERLQTISENQEKLLNKFSNGFGKELTTSLNEIKTDTGFLKVLFSLIGVVIVVTVIVTTVINHSQASIMSRKVADAIKIELERR